jgi:hypothetical protein
VKKSTSAAEAKDRRVEEIKALKAEIAELKAIRSQDRTTIDTLNTQLKASRDGVDVLNVLNNDLRDKLMAATLQVERMSGYLDALADHEPPPEEVPQPTQFVERLLRRDSYGHLSVGVPITKGGRRQSVGDAAYSAFTNEPLAAWWHR